MTVRNVNRGQIPSPVGPEADRASEVERRLSILESPDAGVLARTVQTLQETVDALGDIVAEQAAQISFLQTQSVGTAKGTTIATSRSTVGSITLEAYNATYDCSLVVTTGDSGVLMISVGGLVGPSSGATAGIGLEIVGTGIDPDNTNSVMANGTSVSVGASRTVVVVGLAANTAYTVRTRRWYFGTTPNCLWGYATLTATRLR